jgi:hypothetical protein
MNISITFGGRRLPAHGLGQAAELQAFLRKAAEAGETGYSSEVLSEDGLTAKVDSGSGDVVFFRVIVSEHLSLEDVPSPAATIADILVKTSEMLAGAEGFDKEVVVHPFEDAMRGTDGYSAYWTPEGGDEIRANITAVVHPEIETIYGCGDSRKLAEMEEDPDWVPRHCMKRQLLRYADYSRNRLVQFEMETVAEWIRAGKLPGYIAVGPRGLVKKG